MVRMPAFNHPTCDAEGCGAHFYPRRNGPHMRAELVIPSPGEVQGAVYRVWDDNGYRAAYMDVYDGQGWMYGLPLPSRPRKVLAPAVQRARRFVRSGVLA